MRHPHLSRAPIAEALIDIRSTLREGFSADVLRNATGALRERLPVVEERTALQAMFELRDGVPKARSENLGIQAVFYKSQDEKKIAQFKTDGFTMNHLSPYSRFEDLIADAMDAWCVYRDLVRPVGPFAGRRPELAQPPA